MARSEKTFAVAAVLAATVFAGCYRTETQPILAGQDIALTVLHTSDLHSRLIPYRAQPGLIDRGYGLCAEYQPFGGAARLQYLVQRERARSDRVMHLDSGDCFQGAPIFNEFKGEAEMRVMTALGPDAVVIGNHEFDLGAENLAKQYGSWGYPTFPLLAANYLWSDPADPAGHALGRLSEPFTLMNLEGLKIAVIGMGNTSSMTSVRHGGNSVGITPLEPVEALRAQVEQVHDMVDLVFIVSHMGLTARQELNLAEDTEVITGYERTVPADAIYPCYYKDESKCWKTLSTTPDGQVRVHVPGVSGVDAIFGGHLHIVLNPPKVLEDPSGRPVLLVHSGAFAKFFGRADLVVRMPEDGAPAPWGAEIVSHKYTVVPVTGRIPKEDPFAVVDCPANGASTRLVEPGRDAVGSDAGCLTLFGAAEEILRCDLADRCRLTGDACSDTCRDARRECKSIPAPTDAAMVELLDPYVRDLYQNTNLTYTFAHATERIERFGLSGEDSELGNMVADSMRFRNRVEAQFALTNSLGIRTNMESGLVSIEQMFNIFPFENSLTTIFLSGLEVQELFDYVTERSTERGCQTQAQISGVTFTMNCAQELRNVAAPACLTGADCEDTEFAAQGRQDVPLRCVDRRCFKSPAEDILIEGKPLQRTERYKAAVNDFIGRGGSGFDVLRRNTTKKDTGLSLRDALIDYMRLPPADGGPGRACGSPFMVAPPAPVRPFVRYNREEEPTRSCTPGAGSDIPENLPSQCNGITGEFVRCETTSSEVHVYCRPYDFRTCEELARVAPMIDRRAAVDQADGCEVKTEENCSGVVHCCETDIGEGKVDARYFCMVPLCIDPPETGRITRIIQ